MINNYRPISLLSYLSKVLEKLIKSRFDSFFIKHGVLDDFQFGFRQNLSVIHALLDVTTLTYDSMQKKCYTALLSMDLRIAFDTVSHKIILHKLQYYGIRRSAHTLIKSYLSSKKHFVSINNASSFLESIEIGVPQDYMLGPLFFLFHIKNLSNTTLSKLRLFADDTCLVFSNSSLLKLEDNCNRELNNLKKWCNANKLKINPEKSAVVLVPPKLNV